tara:strand:+ start:19346 stop:19669 length:324 start_codon:yes stop_codon:yes gene_type:complete
VFHIFLHFLVPLLASLAVSRQHWLKIWLIMMATMAVDLDHLLANPIYDPSRCSIGFHPLHQWPWFIVYGGLSAFKQTRWIGLGLLIHMALDSIDCQWTNGIWYWLGG